MAILIDADELNERLNLSQWFTDILLTKANTYDMLYALGQFINEQPTAYDVDNVVKQLEDQFKYKCEFGKECIEEMCEIVKAGEK